VDEFFILAGTCLLTLDTPIRRTLLPINTNLSTLYNINYARQKLPGNEGRQASPDLVLIPPTSPQTLLSRLPSVMRYRNSYSAGDPISVPPQCAFLHPPAQSYHLPVSNTQELEKGKNTPRFSRSSDTRFLIPIPVLFPSRPRSFKQNILRDVNTYSPPPAAKREVRKFDNTLALAALDIVLGPCGGLGVI